MKSECKKLLVIFLILAKGIFLINISLPFHEVHLIEGRP